MSSPEVNAAERARLVVERRLAELGISKRDFGKHFRHGDAWAGGILTGKIKLALRDLDEVARICRTTTSALVKRDDEEEVALRPSELRMVRAIRSLPVAIRDHVVLLAEYLVGVAPSEIDFLKEYRDLTLDEQTRVQNWVDVTLRGRKSGPAREGPTDPAQTNGPPAVTTQRTGRVRKG